MALEFHARLGILIPRTSRFILQPNLSPVGVSAHKSATTSVSTRGVHEEGRSEARIWSRESTARSLAEMKNKNE